MGKAARWFKGLFGMNKDKENMDNLSNCSEKKDKKRWSFGRPSGGKDYSGFVSAGEVVVGNGNGNGMNNVTDSAWLRSLVSETEKEQNKHAIAVAAATAAAADAAVAAAQAAVAVVRLTGQGRAALFHVERHKLAAIKIQSVFRGYLSRKALRALKGLVKLQALVRGYLVRKRATATLHSMQALIRAQASVRSQRARRSINNDHKISSDSRVRRSREKLDECRSEYHSKRLSGSYDATFGGFDESPKIVEIDTYKTRSRSRRIHTCMSDSGDDHHYHHHPSHHSHHYLPVSSPFPCPIPARQSIPEDNFDWNNIGNDDYKKFATAQNTPRFLNSRPSSNCPLPVTPSKSVCGDSFFRPYSNYPSYMSNTQSFKAKLRSQSAPKQRPETVQRKRLSLNEMMASRTSFSGVRMQRPCSQVEEDLNF